MDREACQAKSMGLKRVQHNWSDLAHKHDHQWRWVCFHLYISLSSFFWECLLMPDCFFFLYKLKDKVHSWGGGDWRFERKGDEEYELSSFGLLKSSICDKNPRVCGLFGRWSQDTQAGHRGREGEEASKRCMVKPLATVGNWRSNPVGNSGIHPWGEEAGVSTCQPGWYLLEGCS